ncbi:MAG TPA: aminotransferase class III-fold pyridoxal phosphate-dependent enzyme, partial [Actinomycetota bacterium]
NVVEEEGLLGHVAAAGAVLASEIRRLAPAGTVAEVRGRGFLCGVRVAPGIEPQAVALAMLRRGVLASTAGADAVRFTPPFVATAADLDEGVKVLAEALEEVAP